MAEGGCEGNWSVVPKIEILDEEFETKCQILDIVETRTLTARAEHENWTETATTMLKRISHQIDALLRIDINTPELPEMSRLLYKERDLIHRKLYEKQKNFVSLVQYEGQGTDRESDRYYGIKKRAWTDATGVTDILWILKEVTTFKKEVATKKRRYKHPAPDWDQLLS